MEQNPARAVLRVPEWNLLKHCSKRSNVRVVTIKYPPAAFEEMTSDTLAVGKVFDLSPQLAILMMAAGWVRNESRCRIRRQRDWFPAFNRRETNDRRSAHGA